MLMLVLRILSFVNEGGGFGHLIFVTDKHFISFRQQNKAFQTDVGMHKRLCKESTPTITADCTQRQVLPSTLRPD